MQKEDEKRKKEKEMEEREMEEAVRVLKEGSGVEGQVEDVEESETAMMEKRKKE